MSEAYWLGLADRSDLSFRVVTASESTLASPTPAELTLPRLRWGEHVLPVIALIDARPLDHCVVLETWPQYETAENVRYSLLNLQSGQLEETEINIHEICPEDGVLLVAGSAVEYRVVLRHTVPPTPRQPVERVVLRLRAAEPFLTAKRQCLQGDAEQCIEAAEMMQATVGVRYDADEFEELMVHACEIEAGWCWQAAGLSEGRERVAIIERACWQGGIADACGSLGDHRRLGEGVPANYGLAQRAYDEMCRLGQNEGCVLSEALVRVRLVPSP